MIKKSKAKYLVITPSDAKFGDFLIQHWLTSLVDHIDKNLVDIIILDYGLTPEQKTILAVRNIRVITCKRDGHVVNIRYRDILHLLQKSKYEQVLTCDSGDIIFQADVMPLFTQHTHDFRAVCEDIPPPAIEYTLLNDGLSHIEEINAVLKHKKMINGGLVVAPIEKFKHLCRQMLSIITNMAMFGPDQVVLNYVLYKEGFVKLDRKYNFVITTTKVRFKIRNGVFYAHDGEKIVVVHNAGAHPFLRPIKNFGYGPGYNKFKPFAYYFLRSAYRVLMPVYKIKMRWRMLRVLQRMTR